MILLVDQLLSGLWPLPDVGEDQAVPGCTCKHLPTKHFSSQELGLNLCKRTALGFSAAWPWTPGRLVHCFPCGTRWDQRSLVSKSSFWPGSASGSNFLEVWGSGGGRSYRLQANFEVDRGKPVWHIPVGHPSLQPMEAPMLKFP